MLNNGFDMFSSDMDDWYDVFYLVFIFPLTSANRLILWLNSQKPTFVVNVFFHMCIFAQNVCVSLLQVVVDHIKFSS